MKSINLNAVIEGVRAKKDRSLGLSISTPELSIQEKALIFELQGLNLNLVITPLDIKDAPEVKINTDLNQKTPAQRLRNVLYILFDQKHEENETFESFYNTKMEKIIESLKARLEE